MQSKYFIFLALIFLAKLAYSQEEDGLNKFQYKDEPWSTNRLHIMAGPFFIPNEARLSNNELEQFSLSNGYQLIGAYSITNPRLPFQFQLHGGVERLTPKFVVNAPAGSIYTNAPEDKLKLIGPNFWRSTLGLQIAVDSKVKRNRKFRLSFIYCASFGLNQQRGTSRFMQDLPDGTNRMVMDFVYKTNPRNRLDEPQVSLQLSIIQKVTNTAAISINATFAQLGTDFYSGSARFYPQNANAIDLPNTVLRNGYFGISLGYIPITMKVSDILAML